VANLNPQDAARWEFMCVLTWSSQRRWRVAERLLYNTAGRWQMRIRWNSMENFDVDPSEDLISCLKQSS